MSARSRARPWWKECDILGHAWGPGRDSWGACVLCGETVFDLRPEEIPHKDWCGPLPKRFMDLVRSDKNPWRALVEGCR